MPIVEKKNVALCVRFTFYILGIIGSFVKVLMRQAFHKHRHVSKI